MTRIESLRSLENLLETFLEKSVALKENRLTVLEGMNRLDDIALHGQENAQIAGQVGDWLAEHVNWLNGSVIKPVDADRIKSILGNISEELTLTDADSGETKKIKTEIDRWRNNLHAEPIEPAAPVGQKIVLRRGPESIEEKDNITSFTELFKSLLSRWESAASGRKHVLSALDDLLKSAYLQHNEEALLLSAFIIYYLRQKGYLVEPYVKRLKAAESLIKKGETRV